MDVYAPGWLRDVDNIRVLITQIGFVQMAVRAPRRLSDLSMVMLMDVGAHLQRQTPGNSHSMKASLDSREVHVSYSHTTQSRVPSSHCSQGC